MVESINQKVSLLRSLSLKLQWLLFFLHLFLCDSPPETPVCKEKHSSFHGEYSNSQNMCSVLAGAMYLIFSYKCPEVKPICFTEDSTEIISAVASIHMPVNLFLDTVNPGCFCALVKGMLKEINEIGNSTVQCSQCKDKALQRRELSLNIWDWMEGIWLYWQSCEKNNLIFFFIYIYIHFRNG